MTKFYICTSGIAKGPYRINEIEQLNLHSDDLIWSADYGTNVKAREIPEFAEYFKKKNIYAPQFSRNYTMPYRDVIISLMLAVLLLMIGYYVFAM